MQLSQLPTEIIVLLLSFLDADGLRQIRGTSTRFQTLVEYESRNRVRDNISLVLEVLPVCLRSPWPCYFLNFYSMALYVQIDLNYSSPTVPELLLAKVRLPSSSPRARSLAYCHAWSLEMTDLSVLRLKSEFLTYWSGPLLFLEDFLPEETVLEIEDLAQEAAIEDEVAEWLASVESDEEEWA